MGAAELQADGGGVAAARVPRTSCRCRPCWRLWPHHRAAACSCRAEQPGCAQRRAPRSKRRLAAAGAVVAGAPAQGSWRPPQAAIGRRYHMSAPGGGDRASRRAHSARRVARAAQAPLPAFRLLTFDLEHCRKLPGRPRVQNKHPWFTADADLAGRAGPPTPKRAPTPPSPLCRSDLESKALGHHAGHRCRPLRHCGPCGHHRQGRHRRQGGHAMATTAMCDSQAPASAPARLTLEAYPAPPAPAPCRPPPAWPCAPRVPAPPAASPPAPA